MYYSIIYYCNGTSIKGETTFDKDVIDDVLITFYPESDIWDMMKISKLEIYRKEDNQLIKTMTK